MDSFAGNFLNWSIAQDFLPDLLSGMWLTFKLAVVVNVCGLMAGTARDQGLIIRMVGSRVCLAPPLIISADEIRQMAGMLGRALDAAWGEYKAGAAERVA